jgi:rhodanese-related sulfurtransferase
MERFLEYAAQHPFLVGGTALLALAVTAYELSRLRDGGQNIGSAEAVRLLNQGALLLDVRTQSEFDAGHVIDARHIPQSELSAGLEKIKKYKDKVVITFCESGMRSGAAARTLRGQGFTKVVNLRGGLRAWQSDNLPLVKTTNKGKK